MSSADAYHNRFAQQSSNQTEESRDQNGRGFPTSHSNFSFPDLDAGQYISSQPPNLPSSLSQAPITTNTSDLPSFPEFSAFDTAPSSFLNDRNSFSQYLSNYNDRDKRQSESAVSTSGAAGLGSNSVESEDRARQSEDVARLEAAASSVGESSEEGGRRGELPTTSASAGGPILNSSASMYSNHRTSLAGEEEEGESAPSSAYHSPEQVLRQQPLPPHMKQQQQQQQQQGWNSPSSRASVTSSSNNHHQSKNFSRQINEMDLNQMDLNGRGGRTPEPGTYPLGAGVVGSNNTEIEDGMDDENENGPPSGGTLGRDRSARPNSFFGMERPSAAIDASGQQVPVGDGFGGLPGGENEYPRNGYNDAASGTTGGRPSSFFGVDSNSAPSNSGLPQPPNQAEPSQAAKIAAYHRGGDPAPNSTATSSSTSIPATNGMPNGGLGPSSHNTSSGRPASIAPSVTSGALLDHSHLKPGQSAALLSHGKTLELYRQNAKKTNDPNLIYEFAVFMIDASKSMGGGEDSSPKLGAGAGAATSYGGATGDSPNPNTSAVDSEKEELVREAIGLLKKIAERGHPDAQYFLADCYANGIGTLKGKQDFDKAYPLFVLAAKHGHADASYRAATCYEKGWGCRKDPNKAIQFYRKAASQSHPGAMYRLATAELNGELGLKKSAREGVKWLKRSAEAATPEFPHALHELALLHERGIDNLIFVDPEYACELLAQAGEMGYAPSAYKLGVNYEYGRMGCPQDGGLSIHMYNIAAQQNHKEACFALTAWYLVGAPGILPQSDTEAYLWAKKAAEQGMAKAEYAVGYFTEMGIGTVKDLTEARAWYLRAAEHGDRRANQRLAALSGRAVPSSRSPPTAAYPNGMADAVASPYEQGRLAAGNMAQNPNASPINAPFPGSVPSSYGPSRDSTYPSPIAMREAQTAQRSQAKEAAIADVQWRQSIASAQNGQSRSGHPQPSSARGRERPTSNMNHNPGMDPRRASALPPGAGGPPQGMAYPSYPAAISSAPPPGASPSLNPNARLPPQMRSPPSSSGHSFNSNSHPPQPQGMYAAQMGSPAAFGQQAPGIRQWDAAAIGQAMDKAPSPAPAAAAGGEKKKGWFSRS